MALGGRSATFRGPSRPESNLQTGFRTLCWYTIPVRGKCAAALLAQKHVGAACISDFAPVGSCETSQGGSKHANTAAQAIVVQTGPEKEQRVDHPTEICLLLCGASGDRSELQEHCVTHHFSLRRPWLCKGTSNNFAGRDGTGGSHESTGFGQPRPAPDVGECLPDLHFRAGNADLHARGPNGVSEFDFWSFASSLDRKIGYLQPAGFRKQFMTLLRVSICILSILLCLRHVYIYMDDASFVCVFSLGESKRYQVLNIIQELTEPGG